MLENVSITIINWQLRENARVQIRVMAKRILRKYGYTPDMQTKATEFVFEQAEAFCEDGSQENSGGSH